MIEKKVFLRPDHLIRDEIKMYCKTLRTFVDKEVLPHENEFDDYWDWSEREEPTFVHDLFKKLLVDLGIQQGSVPTLYGGQGDWSMVETSAIVAEVARGDHGLAESGFIASWTVASAMMPSPNDAMMKKIAGWLLQDEPFLICSAISEPEGGGNVEDVVGLKGSQTKTRTRLEGDQWVINGQKLWPSAYREAKAFLVICAVEGEEYPNNIANIIVPADTEGVSTGKPYRKMGTSIDTNGEIWFDNVRVPKEYRLHEGEDEVKSLTAKESVGRMMAGAFALGMMRRAYELLTAYVDNRKIGGMPMKEHGAIVHELGQITEDIHTAESVFWTSVERMDHPEVYGPPWDMSQLVTASLAANVTSEFAEKAISRALELMGSYGYTKEGKMEKLYRDVKISKIVVGGPVLRKCEGSRYYFGTQTV